MLKYQKGQGFQERRVGCAHLQRRVYRIEANGMIKRETRFPEKRDLPLWFPGRSSMMSGEDDI